MTMKKRKRTKGLVTVDKSRTRTASGTRKYTPPKLFELNLEKLHPATRARLEALKQQHIVVSASEHLEPVLEEVMQRRRRVVG